MRGRHILIRAAMVAVLAIGGTAVAPGAAQAHAPTPAGVTAPNAAQVNAVPVTTILAIAKAAYDLYKSFKAGSLSVQDATNQIIAAINSAKVEILSHIDAIATAQARACAQAAIIDVNNFDVLTPANQQLFALNTTNCVTLIDSLLTAVTDKAALDQLGFALDTVGPIALIVRSRVGFDNTGFTPVLVHSNQTTLSRVAPVCTPHVIEGRTQWTCSSYNGDVGGPEPSLSLAQREAGDSTSWSVAKAVLPVLTSL